LWEGTSISVLLTKGCYSPLNPISLSRLQLKNEEKIFYSGWDRLDASTIAPCEIFFL
jgi:hypothetical protein